jgi:hypothetical protein
MCVVKEKGGFCHQLLDFLLIIAVIVCAIDEAVIA